MSATRTILTGAAALFLVAAFMTPAMAQTGLVDTSIDTSGSDQYFGKGDDSGLDRGNTDAQAFASAKFCWAGPGAFNAEGTGWTLKPTITGPEWADVRVSTTEGKITPPTGPSSAAGCIADALSFTFMGGPTDVAENGTEGDVTISWTLDGPDQIGSYKKPAVPGDTVMKLVVKESDTLLDNITNAGGAGGAGIDGGNEPAEESPSAVAPLTLLIGLVFLAAARRRR